MGVPVTQWKQIQLGAMSLQVWSLASLSGLRIQRCLELWCSRRQDSDLALLWLWCRPAAVAPIWPLPWEPLYAEGVALKKKKKSKEKAWIQTEACSSLTSDLSKCTIYKLLRPKLQESSLILSFPSHPTFSVSTGSVLPQVYLFYQCLSTCLAVTIFPYSPISSLTLLQPRLLMTARVIVFSKMCYEATPLPNWKPWGRFGLCLERNASSLLWLTMSPKVWSLPPPLTTSFERSLPSLHCSHTVSFLLLNTLELFLASGSLQLVLLPGKWTPWLFTLLALHQPWGLSLNIASLWMLVRFSNHWATTGTP